MSSCMVASLLLKRSGRLESMPALVELIGWLLQGFISTLATVLLANAVTGFHNRVSLQFFHENCLLEALELGQGGPYK